MSHAAPGRPEVVTPSPAISRREVEADDDELLRDLFAHSRVDVALLPPATLDVLLDGQYRAQRQRYAARYPHARHDVLVVDGVDAGQLILDIDADAVRIVNVTVHQEHRGRGIGSATLSEVIAEAHGAGRAVRLSVWSANKRARRFYRRLGFQVVGMGDGYLEMQLVATPES